mmetsp:Transcript_35861/g.65131  ORF Transcript_35861/g.65131 Transcript_35861/m.65131 type:complete len:117 (-) Transcript_35861:190-540(-)|eukprot:CAMPEP_0197627100 /NCGR_PEP_ID=MMETSP1338-20131121/5805_1 /TAXON_ID=43686 ORGANISM="Pelagodinium beii, Strain RCC1491" /NCGR_SAMPLE_ID=MMETSP1338 /ASSEMBLY_ACC=CAM_ASM_000754 /LENGTH=116 /DNA_ID=CAMNT_0043197723 /DNA_START=119 /DNA_END=469 /DNA_ORIENTATION=-
MAMPRFLLHCLFVLCLFAATASRRVQDASHGVLPHVTSAPAQAIDAFDQTCSRQADQAAERPEISVAHLPDHVFQDVRLILSFALGIAFMHFMEVMKPRTTGMSPQHKFELYPYVL